MEDFNTSVIDPEANFEEIAMDVVQLSGGAVTYDEALQAIETMDAYGFPIDPVAVKEFIEDVV